ncbi:hypothetical protein Tco_1417347 [Tanacetum coccineum]
MEEYMTKTRDDYGSGIVRPNIDDKARFKLKGQFLKELQDNNFSGLDNEDANEHIEKTRSTDTSDELAAIQAQLNNLRMEIKKVNEKVYDAQVKAFEEAFYTQYSVPFPPGGRFRTAALGFYQRDNRNPLYQE